METHLKNIALIESSCTDEEGMDYLIISSSSESQARFWQERLEQTRRWLLPEKCVIISVFEDWPTGAGNGLGTLYAWKKAKEQTGIELAQALANGARISMYHTAGRGTRLAPLTLAETNNKPAVRLPGLVAQEGPLITMLEATIKQTAVYSRSRPGRLSVFWGDQIFLPSAPAHYTPTHHVDLLVRLFRPPTEAEWLRFGMERYGLLTLDHHGSAQQVEKIDYSTYCQLRAAGDVNVEGGVGISLGSFSISAPFLDVLCDEFDQELAERRGKFDTDPHFWMPLTLNWGTYRLVMERKGINTLTAERQYSRMQALKQRWLSEESDMGMLGAVDIGADAYWWDYGQLPLYFDNALKMLSDDQEGEVLRRFFNVEKQGESIVIGSHLQQNSLERSVVAGVFCPRISARNSVLIDVHAPAIQANEGLGYHVCSPNTLKLHAKEVATDVPQATEWLRVETTLDVDNTLEWQGGLYSRLYEMNQERDTMASSAYWQQLVRAHRTD